MLLVFVFFLLARIQRKKRKGALFELFLLVLLFFVGSNLEGEGVETSVNVVGLLLCCCWLIIGCCCCCWLIVLLIKGCLDDSSLIFEAFSCVHNLVKLLLV